MLNFSNTALTMRYFLTFMLFCCALAANAQKVVFRADCNAEDVAVNSPFKVSYVLENADVKNISFPKFEKDGFSVIQGPMNESRYMNVNGKSSNTEAYVFLLAPKKVGKFTLGPAKVVTTKGKVLTTRSIEINSVSASAKNTGFGTDNLPAGVSGKVIFRMLPSTEKAIPGEQVIVDLKVYTQLDLASIGLSVEPKSEKADLIPVSYNDQETSVDVINGKRYASKTIYKFSFVAGSPGTVEINPAAIQFVEVYSSNPFSRPQNYTLLSNPLKIKVEEIKKQPATFKGAVGNFSMFVNLEKTSITSDDLLNLIVTVEGIGDLKKITEVPVLFGKKGGKPFEIYPPKLVENLSEGANGKTGIKDFIYKLEPNATGDFEIRPTFTYFDTDQRRFITIDTIIPVRVLQGKKRLDKSSSEEEVDDKKISLSFGDAIESARWSKPAGAFFGSIFFWILTFIPFAAFMGLAGSRVYLKKRYEEMMKQRALTKANRELDEHMKNALLHLKNSNAPAFYQAISESFKNFLGRKLKIPKAEISKEIMAEKLQGLVDEDKIRSLTRILKICELSVFAGQDNIQAMQLVYDDSNELLGVFTKIFA
jgi:hypothetical protein